MESLSGIVDLRDAYTAGHSRRVRDLALAMGKDLGLSAAELDVLGRAALFTTRQADPSRTRSCASPRRCRPTSGR